MGDTERDSAFGSLLRAHRQARGLTQEALAERTGVGTRTIQELERGAHQPYRDTLARLVKGLELGRQERLWFEQAAQPLPRRHPNLVGIASSRKTLIAARTSHQSIPQTFPSR